MNIDQHNAIPVVALLAAFADGANDEREREQIRRLAETLGGEPEAPDLAALWQQVLLKRARLEDVVAELAAT